MSEDKSPTVFSPEDCAEMQANRAWLAMKFHLVGLIRQLNAIIENPVISADEQRAAIFERKGLKRTLDWAVDFKRMAEENEAEYKESRMTDEELEGFVKQVDEDVKRETDNE